MRSVLLVGQGITAPTALQSLAARCRVAGVVRTAEPSVGPADPVIAFAHRHDIPVFGNASIAGVREVVDQVRPECLVISSFDRILPADLIAACPVVNVHYAPLPRYRGRANVNWSLINGEPFTAITIHVVDGSLDSGNVLYQKLVPIQADDTVADLYERLNELQRQHLGDTVVRFLDGDTGIPQEVELATYGCTRLPGDGEIDWSQPTDQISALIRALVRPFPGAFTYLNGRRLVIWRARAVDPAPCFAGRVPGRVVHVSREDGSVDVLTGDGVLRLFEVEGVNQAPAPAAAVIRSVRATLGLSKDELLSRIETLEREIASLREDSFVAGGKHAN